MAVYFSEHTGLGNADQAITVDNYKTLILKVGISKLPEALLKGHQFYSGNIHAYHTDYSIAETIDDYLTDLNSYVQNLPEKRRADIFKEDNGYSGRKWTGSKYKLTENLSTSEISKLIKKELEIEFEGIAKFSVTSDVYSGGSSINVSMYDVSFNPYNEQFLKAFQSGQTISDYEAEHRDSWNRNPDRFNEEFKATIAKVKNITNQYNFDDSDSQSDYFHRGYYDHVNFDENTYLIKHFPESAEAKRHKAWNEEIKASKAKSKAKADANKAKFKKGAIVFYKAEMHSSWHKYKLKNGLYLVQITKAPNGRARYGSYYSIRILEDITVLKESTLNYLKKKGEDKYFIINEYGTFYHGSAITGYEENMLALDDPAAKQVNEPKDIPVKKEAKKKIEKAIPTTVKAANKTVITIDNYTSQHFDTSTWPDQLKQGHVFVTGDTDWFKNIDLYQEDETIKQAIDKHIAAVNAFVNATPGKTSKSKAKENTFPSTPVKQVALSVKFIKRYANLHGKTLTEKQLGAFIKPLTKAILTQQIRLADPHADMIRHIQDQLIQTYNSAGPDDKIKFTITNVEKYKAVGKSENEMLAVRLLKRYVALLGKSDTTKLKKLHKDMWQAINFGEVGYSDTLKEPLQIALKNLHAVISEGKKLEADQAELNGLQGLGFIPMMIAAAVGKGIEHLAHKVLKPSAPVSGLGCECNHTPKSKPVPLSGLQNSDVMSVKEALSLKFNLIGLDGDYLKLIGEACKPTSFFIYGPGGSGKSTLTLLFSDYMAKKGNKVLYVAGEQHRTPVFSKMLDRLKIQDSPNFTIVKRIDNLNPKDFDIMVIDSKDSLDYQLEDFKHQREQNPNLSFVILSQGTKSGSFTGTEKWRNEVDTLVYCESMVAYTNRDKNRWGGSAEIAILKLLKSK